MEQLQKLNLTKKPTEIGAKVGQSVAPHVETAGRVATAAVNATIKPEKHLPAKAALLILVIAAGILSGWGINWVTTSEKTVSSGSTRGGVPTVGIKVGDVVGAEGSPDQVLDTAEGVLQQGGLEGEGSHHLLRPGGSSQTVYLTSSVVDLDEFMGHRVTVWGETFAGQKAGWLMDVIKVRVEELSAPIPEGN